MAKFIKNNTQVSKTWVGQLIEPNAYYEIQSIEDSKWANDSLLLIDISSGEAVVAKSNDGTQNISDVNEAINYLKDLIKDVKVTSQPDPAPFAQPLYRTKMDATSSWITCPSDQNTIADFQLTSELYVSGGEILLKDAKEGDYISAEVYDTNSVIPNIPYPLNPNLTYRQALCEAWPSVSKYVLKRFILPCSGYSIYKLDTRPLNAKITIGLYLRITYHATNEAGDRKIAVNYDLTKKL